jgi:hypothetical protein
MSGYDDVPRPHDVRSVGLSIVFGCGHRRAPRSGAWQGALHAAPNIWAPGPGINQASFLKLWSTVNSGRQRREEQLGAMAIQDIPIAPRSPWQNGYVERLIGSIRRECLDHVIVLNERHLRRILRSCFAYYNQARTHLTLNKDAPIPRRPCFPVSGSTVAFPEVGGMVKGALKTVMLNEFLGSTEYVEVGGHGITAYYDATPMAARTRPSTCRAFRLPSLVLGAHIVGGVPPVRQRPTSVKPCSARCRSPSGS